MTQKDLQLTELEEKIVFMESTIGTELKKLTLQNEKLEAAYKGIEEENTGLMDENKR